MQAATQDSTLHCILCQDTSLPVGHFQTVTGKKFQKGTQEPGGSRTGVTAGPCKLCREKGILPMALRILVHKDEGRSWEQQARSTSSSEGDISQGWKHQTFHSPDLMLLSACRHREKVPGHVLPGEVW